MNVLAFDTATQYLSLALVTDNDCIRQDLMPGTGHAQLLFSEIDSLLDRASLSLADIDLLGVGSGPGSFTGVRVGVSAAQAIAFAQSIPVLGVSSLAAMAAQAETDHALAVMDARMDEIYAGYYQSVAGQPRLCGVETVQAATDLVLPDNESESAGWTQQAWSVVALGWPIFGDRLTQAFGETPPIAVRDDVHPSASVIASIAQSRFTAGEPGDWQALVPSYVRNQVAEVAAKK